MMVIGASLATIDLKKLFTDGKLLLFAAIKLLIIPIAGMLVIRGFVTNEVICGVCMVMLATALTTILSVVTMPIVSMIVM